MFTISSRDFEITQAMREEIEGLKPSLTRHLPESEKVKVTLSKTSPDTFRVHMQVHYLGEEIVSDQESHNYHKALELCKDHFVKQVDKRREKVQQRG